MVPRNLKSIVKGFSYSLPDVDLNFICSRLYYNYQDDLAEACDFFANIQADNIEVIRSILENSASSSEFYHVLDEIKASVLKEYERRGLSVSSLV